ncbi:segregation and condensation protein A [Microlunatus flavus]|uniref:Segregation and condensation protein A n=1 Tax=Microlunatus flavus TaxID=1036181 RepID=A0A1H9MRU9_9ACTN|nr:ScpA family protein [Microlunatus flavus]SER26207.1 condensin subunit ScpA [Microlunatus flavus]
MTSEGPAARGSFDVHLTNFEGPFDLLLQLIGRRQLDITEIALSQVTDDFIAHVKAAGSSWDLDQTTQFVLVAATLLDLKAARLIPSGEVEDPEDLALLEARDLLFARLLAYRAFKQVAAWLGDTLASESRRVPRATGLEPHFARLLPEVELTITPDQLAALAARAMAPKVAEVVSLAHIHAPAVSVTEQAGVLVDRLRRQRVATFRALTGDADRLTTVARFLALLELFREGAVAFEQVSALGELTVRWTGADSGELEISDEFDADPDDQTEGHRPGPTPEDSTA